VTAEKPYGMDTTPPFGSPRVKMLRCNYRSFTINICAHVKNYWRWDSLTVFT